MKNGSDRHERSHRGERSRADILAAAIEVFSELGPDGATLRLIARRTGVNIATLMYYFPSKEALFAEVVGMLEGGELRIVELWRDSLVPSTLSRLDSLKEALTELGIMIIDRVIDDPGRFRLGVFSALDASRQEQAENGGAGSQGATLHSPEREAVRDVLVKAMELGAFRADPRELDDYIEGYTYLSRGFAMTHIAEIAKGSMNRDSIIRRFRNLIHRYVNNMLPREAD